MPNFTIIEPEFQEEEPSHLEPQVFLRGVFNLLLNDARPEVILKAYIDYLQVKKMREKRKPRLTRSGHRALQKDFKRRLQL